MALKGKESPHQPACFDIVPDEAQKESVKHRAVLGMVLQQVGPTRKASRVPGYGFERLSGRTLQCHDPARVAFYDFIVLTAKLKVV